MITSFRADRFAYRFEKVASLVASQHPGVLLARHVGPPGGALGYFLGGYVPPGIPNWHPVLEKNSPKIDTPF